MAANSQFDGGDTYDVSGTYDVCIVQTNTVYRSVPFAVITDWLQQGRLLDDDKVRPAGVADWIPLANEPSFAPYLTRQLPRGAEDRAEALEPVELDISWKRHDPDDEDDDVDMIPLIDVSLVLLIFFMMTATVTSAASLIRTPRAGYGSEASSDQGMLWVGVELRADGEPYYSLGQGSQPPREEDKHLEYADLIRRLDERLHAQSVTDVRIKADEETPDGVIKRLRIALEPRRQRGLFRSLKDEVREENRP
jgi:biopolymer transport protein ExbD